MFLVDINVKASSCGTPLINEENELVGIISEPIYFIDGSKDLVLPGTWVCAVPAGLTFPSLNGEEQETKQEDQSTDKPKPKQKPKKKGGAKKKKGKKR